MPQEIIPQQGVESSEKLPPNHEDILADLKGDIEMTYRRESHIPSRAVEKVNEILHDMSTLAFHGDKKELRKSVIIGCCGRVNDWQAKDFRKLDQDLREWLDQDGNHQKLRKAATEQMGEPFFDSRRDE